MSIITPDPTLEFIGLFADQTEDVIMARAIDWANEGLDPQADAELWQDTREGGHWRMCMTPMVRELARVYDLAGTEVPMSGFVLWAWGSYLDDLAAVYKVTRLQPTASTGTETFTGEAGTDITLGTTVGVAPVNSDAPAPTYAVTQAGTIPDAGGGTGSITLPIQATNPGADGDVAANAITAMSTPLPAGVTFTNSVPTRGGSDLETDEALRSRVLRAIGGRGPGAVNDYLTWAGQWPGVGQVKVVPTWNGPGSVLVVIDDADGEPLPAATVTGLQQDLDPVPGKGEGTAPVGAQVTVETSSLLEITYAATVTYAPGYSANGAGNTIAVGAPIAAAMGAYFRSVQPGDKVRLSHANGIVATWEGVIEVDGGALSASGVTPDANGNLALSLTPPQAADLATLTI